MTDAHSETPVRIPRQVLGAGRTTFPYSPALGAGAQVFVSGQVGIDPATGELAGEDIASQTAQTIDNIEGLLAEAGLDLREVVKTTVFLVEAADFAPMNEVYRSRFGEPFPARSTVVVKALARADLIVEIEAVALRR